MTRSIAPSTAFQPDSRFAPWVPARLRRNRVVALLIELDGRWRMRRSLESLPDHALRDLGLTRSDVYREITKPIWRP